MVCKQLCSWTEEALKGIWGTEGYIARGELSVQAQLAVEQELERAPLAARLFSRYTTFENLSAQAVNLKPVINRISRNSHNL